MFVNSKKAGTLLVALAFVALIALSSISTVMAKGGSGGEEDEHDDVPVLLSCSLGYEMLDQYKWEETSYVPSITSGDNVSVAGTKTAGTFTVTNPYKLVYEVVIRGVGKKDNIARDLYPAGVTSGAFNDSEVKPGPGPGPGVKYVAFCGKDAPTKFQFSKIWTGDAVDLTNVEVTFYIGETAWQLGDPAVDVKPGDVLAPLTEEVTGLPENCTYESNLPESYTVFKDMVSDSKAAILEPTVLLDTLEVTNTVACEDDQPVVVPETPVTPVSTPVTTAPTALPATGTAENITVAAVTSIASILALLSVAAKSVFIRF